MSDNASIDLLEPQEQDALRVEALRRMRHNDTITQQRAMEAKRKQQNLDNQKLFPSKPD